MTEARGRAARWSVAALAAPVAAGLFAGTTAYAAGHDPLHPDGATAKPAAPAPVATGDPTLAALRQAVSANAAAVARLSKQVAAVKAQAAAMAGKGGATGSRTGSSRSGGSSSGRSAGSSSSSRSSGGSTTVVVKVPAPAPPPAQTTTGASGVKK